MLKGVAAIASKSNKQNKNKPLVDALLAMEDAPRGEDGAAVEIGAWARWARGRIAARAGE